MKTGKKEHRLGRIRPVADCTVECMMVGRRVHTEKGPVVLLPLAAVVHMTADTREHRPAHTESCQSTRCHTKTGTK